MGCHKGSVADPQHRAADQQHRLKNNKLDRHAGTADANGHAVFAEPVHLHGLTAGGAGGNVAVIHAGHGRVQALPQLDFLALHAQKVVNGQRVH